VRLPTRWLRAAALLVAAVATVVAMSLVAGAHHTDLLDPNDARGKLDIHEVRLGHAAGPHFWTIVTFARWGIGEMWDAGYLMVMLDTRFSPEAEYYLLIRSDGTSLLGTLWRVHASGPDSNLGAVPVRRLSGRSASVQVRLSRLTFGPTRRFYRWWVLTLYTSAVCPRTCFDRAPNGTTVLQWRPGMSPTPSPSPSPSGSPTP
jgi:hypothetical protein